MCGIVPPGGDRAAHRTVYIDNLRFAARELAKTNRTLLIEPINPRDIPGYFLNTQADAHAIVAEVGEPNLKVQMDFYHAQIVEGDLAMKFKKYFGNIGHVQIAGVPDRHEPDAGRSQLQVPAAHAGRNGLCRMGRLRIPPASKHRRRVGLDATFD